VFERFTDRARQVVVLAQEEARTLKHNYLGTEHILLGLLRKEDGIAAQVLASFEVTLVEVREHVAQIVGEGGEVTTGQIPFTPRAKKVLELALREALSLGHNYIGTEHILLGLTREDGGVAAQILRALGTDAESIRDRIVETLVSEPRTTRRLRGLRPPMAMVGGHAPCWEYLVEGRDAVDADWLNELGAKGWELVSVTPGTQGIAAIFKRRQFPGALRVAG
jgi:ATP-dependent Clp protease ATP-binding subunit ClpA